MGLGDMVSSYVHNVYLIDYMMNSCFACMKLSILVLFMDIVNGLLVYSL